MSDWVSHKAQHCLLGLSAAACGEALWRACGTSSHRRILLEVAGPKKRNTGTLRIQMTGDGALAFGICRWFLDKVTAASLLDSLSTDS